MWGSECAHECRCLWRPGDLRLPETVVVGSCELFAQCESWGSNSDPLKSSVCSLCLHTESLWSLSNLSNPSHGFWI